MSKRDLAGMDADMFTPIGRLLQQGMAHGITNDMIYGGLVTGQTKLQGLYVTQTTRNCLIGTRRVRWDGRVFRYGKCGGESAIVSNKYGIGNKTVLVANKVANGYANEVVMTDAVVGATTITVTYTVETLGDSTDINFEAKNGVVTEDELVGGYISLYTGNYRQNRMIVGNTESTALSESMDITLDEPLDHVLTAGASCYCEILANPYGNLGHTEDERVSILGIPNVIASILDYLWVQTWGVLRISGTVTTLGKDAKEREYVFAPNGVVIPKGEYFSTTDSRQTAGFLIERTQDQTDNYSAAPFIMLQICP